MSGSPDGGRLEDISMLLSHNSNRKPTHIDFRGHKKSCRIRSKLVEEAAQEIHGLKGPDMRLHIRIILVMKRRDDEEDEILVARSC